MAKFSLLMEHKQPLQLRVNTRVLTDFRGKRLVIMKVSNRFNLFTALIQDVDGRKKLTKVIKNVSGSYLEIGLEAGLKQNVIDEKANAQVSGHAKLQAVLGAIKENVGEKEMLRIVLKACKELGIMGGIRDDLS